MRRLAWPFAVAIAALGCGSRTGLLGEDAPPSAEAGIPEAGVASEASPPDARSEASDTGAEAPASCVLYGGFSAEQSGSVADTWTWLGHRWSPSHAALTPPECDVGGHSICGYVGTLVSLGGQLLFVGIESASNATIVETFRWTGTAWVTVATADPPPARFYPGVAALSDRIVLFGGTDAVDGFLNDTWILEDGAWTLASSPAAPSPRSQVAMAAGAGQVVLFGGADGTGVLGDTWLWSEDGWQPAPSAVSPSPRSGAAAATFGGGVLLFGGCTMGGYQGCADVGDSSGETWEWGHGAWVEITTSPSPPPRNVATAAAYGAAVVLFGGFAGSADAESLSDTWIWDGAWTKDPAKGPPARGLAAMACP